ncbi:MAG TPA: exosortase/archaeosortase family protein [Armatimonadota bacterium]|nr:exosortase/archaeosortase family protein [Armatimonadota bacterium]
MMSIAISRLRIPSLSTLAVVAAGAWLYAPVAAEMVQAWRTQDNASHGFLILPIAGYLVWLDRARIARAYRGGATAAGLAWAGVALVMYLGGRWMEVEFLPPLSLVLMIGAQVLYFGGWGVLRASAFPCAFLLFMVPWPDLLVEFLSFPMQLLSAKYAAMLIGLFGIPVTRAGVDLHLASYTFSVGAPCSGMKTLVALLALAALIAHLARGPRWKRTVLFACGVPAALLANVVRIVIILLIATLVSARAAEGFFHGASGMLVFVIALAGLLATGRAMGLGGVLGGAGAEKSDAATG